MNNIKKTQVSYPFLEKPVDIYERENGHKIVFAYKKGGIPASIIAHVMNNTLSISMIIFGNN